MINARFVPIEKWPGKERASYSQKRGPFRISYAKRLDLLEAELDKLNAKDIVIQVYLERNDIRNDGWPRSSARPKRPGVIISFTAKNGDPLSFPCDTYSDWEDNLYAIALSLEALRSVDRYGVTRSAEQYRGWKQVGAPAHEQARTREWAIGHIARVANVPAHTLSNQANLDLAYRAAARATHPDTGGNTQAFQLLQDAISLVR